MRTLCCNSCNNACSICRNNPPSQSTLQLIAELSRATRESIRPLNAVQDFKLRDVDTHEQHEKLAGLKAILDTYQCNQCSSFREHVSNNIL